jgi:hypothetical protein
LIKKTYIHKYHIQKTDNEQPINRQLTVKI